MIKIKHMMVLVVLLTWFLPAENWSANKYILKLNGKPTTFYADKFNEQDFISLRQISKIVFPKSKYLADRGEIHFDILF